MDELGDEFGVEVADVLLLGGEVVDDPLEDALEPLGGILESENSLEVEGTLERDLLLAGRHGRHTIYFILN